MNIDFNKGPNKTKEGIQRMSEGVSKMNRMIRSIDCRKEASERGIKGSGKKPSLYKESMYQKGYSLYQKGMDLKTQAEQIYKDTGNLPANLVEESSELFRKSTLLASAAQRAEG